MIGGALCNDDDYYDRVHEMMSITSFRTNRDNDDCEGLGYRWDSYNNYYHHDATSLPGIPSQSSVHTYFKPLRCFFRNLNIPP